MCRTLDRLSAVIRGPEVPAEAEQVLLQRLRAWLGEAQDLGEVARGVAPNPLQLRAGGVVEHPPEGVGREEPPTPGVTAKAPPAPPPPPPVPGAGGSDLGRQRTELVKREVEDPPRVEAASSSSRVAKKEKKSKKPRCRSSSSHRGGRKEARRSRSGRSRPRAARSPLASPVRPAGVTRSDSEERASRREKKARPVSPRSPSRPPQRHRQSAPPSQRPLGRFWQGAIPARRWEPPLDRGFTIRRTKVLPRGRGERSFKGGTAAIGEGVDASSEEACCGSSCGAS